MSLPVDVIEQIAPLVRAVAEANNKIEGDYYFDLTLNYPGDGALGRIDGDFPDDTFRFSLKVDDD